MMMGGRGSLFLMVSAKTVYANEIESKHMIGFMAWMNFSFINRFDFVSAVHSQS